MKMTEADVIWTPRYDDGTIRELERRGHGVRYPDAGAIRVERHGSGWQRTPGDPWMPATCLGYMGEVPTKNNRDRQLLAMIILFNTITVRDRVNVNDAHNAFLAIDEYRTTISPDAPGAEAVAA
jgi:hypothetical protein